MMRRYRKGQTFRPPTTAEHAVVASAVESFQRQPATPQDIKPSGQSIYVLTPEAGIEGRDDTTIHSALCKRLIETDGPDDTRELVQTDELHRVFNFSESAIAGDTAIMTAVTECGSRHEIRGSGGGADIVFFAITAPGPYLGEMASDCDYVVAVVTKIGCNTSGVSVGDEIKVWDEDRCYFNIPNEILVGTCGKAMKMVNSVFNYDCADVEAALGTCRWEVISLCCTEEIYGNI